MELAGTRSLRIISGVSGQKYDLLLKLMLTKFPGNVQIAFDYNTILCLLSLFRRSLVRGNAGICLSLNIAGVLNVQPGGEILINHSACRIGEIGLN